MMKVLPRRRTLGSITIISNTEDAMRVTTKGQVTIPQPIREHLGILPNTEVEFALEGDHAILRKAGAGSRRGKELVEHLASFKDRCVMTSAEFMALMEDEGSDDERNATE